MRVQVWPSQGHLAKGARENQEPAHTLLAKVAHLVASFPNFHKSALRASGGCGWAPEKDMPPLKHVG